MILGLEIGKTVWTGWIVQIRDLKYNQPLWWIHLEYYRAFGKYTSARLLLKCEIILKGISSSETRVNSEWVKELW